MLEIVSLILGFSVLILASYICHLHNQIEILSEELEVALKNDKRDPETGRYTK